MSSRTRQLLAVDPSLRCSGWALFDISSESVFAVGKLHALPASYSLSDRLLDLQAKVVQVFKGCALSSGDYLVCEGPTTMRDPRAAFRVEQVRGIFETVARHTKVNVPGRINPRSVQREIMGLKGKQLIREHVKDTAVMIVQALYEKELKQLGFLTDRKSLAKHQDIIDAILVGRLAIIRVKSALQAKIAPQKMFDERISSRTTRR